MGFTGGLFCAQGGMIQLTRYAAAARLGPKGSGELHHPRGILYVSGSAVCGTVKRADISGADGE